MKIADLFVDIAIKGADVTEKSITGLRDGMKGLSSMSLEAKAGILGAFYALQQMVAASDRAGTALTLFNDVTGLSTEALQRYQYAARQVGATNEDVTSSIKGIQGAITDMLLGKGPPQALAWVSKVVGGLDKKQLQDPFYMIQKLQEFTQKAPPALARALLPSFRITEGMQAAMREGAFNEKNFKKAPIYSERESKNLRDIGVQWSNLGTKVEMAFGHFNAKHGREIISGLSEITDHVLKLAESLAKLGESMQVFKLMGLVIKGWDLILSPDKKKGGIAAIADELDKSDLGSTKLKDTSFGKMLGTIMPDFLWKLPGGATIDHGKLVPGQTAPAAPKVEVHQNITHHGDAKDTHAVGRTHKMSAKEAHQAATRQLPVHRGGF